MKKSLLLAVSILCVSFGVQAAEKPSNPEKIALGLINDAAGDAWAEGGDVQNIRFTGLKCSLEAKRCELQYSVKFYGKPTSTGACTLNAIAGYGDLIEVVTYGCVLKNGIFEQVDTCMAAAGI